MKRGFVCLLAALALVVGVLAPAADARPRPPVEQDRVDVYTAEVTPSQFNELRKAGLDREDVSLGRGQAGKVRVEVVLGERQAQQLRARGLRLSVKEESKRAQAQAQGVFRPYSGAGGIHDEIVQASSAHSDIAQLVHLGRTVQGKPIAAVRVTKGASRVPVGRRPAVLYMGGQHVREWIGVEMARRLLHHYLNNYGKDPQITRIVDTTEVWFLVVTNPDGYDYTFTPGNRLWRKNMRDNDGDGKITSVDGVDLNRNWPYKWGYDDEGSSPNPASQTYRGTAPLSEPETRAVDGLLKRIRPKFLINYHSAVSQLLYGVGWQVATPTPDDLIFKALVGDDTKSAVPAFGGAPVYDPDLSAELYTTNGETTENAHNVHGVLGITPEMATCVQASNVFPDDQWDPADCRSGFLFPDDERLIQGEFERNIPLALSFARSARDPANPSSSIGRTVPDFDVDTFGVSYGTRQPAAAVMRRSMRDKVMRYRINGGGARTVPVREWAGGERYGDENDTHLAEYRGVVRGARPGDRVQVWFSAVKAGKGRVDSERFTYRVRDAGRAPVLVVANEDYTGINPKYPPSVTRPKHARQYVDALRANGIRAAVWDVDRDGVPHDLGVLGHFKAVAWYLGDNRLTQDPEDELTQTPIGNLRDAAVAERQQYLTIAIRDYLNAGGKLLYTGETAGYHGSLATALGGIWYGLDDDPATDCVITQSFFDDCLILSDDFTQYYLGVWDRAPVKNPTSLIGTDRPLRGVRADFGGPATADNPLDEAGGLQVTSTVLPPSRFPLFRSWKAGDYVGAAGPFEPIAGSWYVASAHEDSLYRRLTRTIDLTQVSAGQIPKLEAQLSFSTESGYDNVIVEARTAGGADWATLPDLNGGTTTTVPTECEEGFLLEEHPWLTHYLTGGNPCRPEGTSGKWNAFTGSSGGWTQTAFDLSAYAGKQVEVSIAYVTDGFTGGAGLFIDDTKVTTTGGTLNTEGFETGLGPWQISGAPEGSPGNTSEFTRSQALIDSVAAVTTTDSVLLGVGLEQVKTPTERARVIGRIMGYLLR